MYAGWDFVLYALLLVVVVLWNFLSKILRRQRRLGDVLPPADTPQPVQESRGRAAGAVPPDWQVVPAVAPGNRDGQDRDRALPSAPRSRRPRWRSRAELRRALVDMAVLGPPRALAPWESSGAAGAEPMGGR